MARKSERFRNPTVACLGLAYKANVDDLRESPAVDIVAAIAEAQPDLDIRVAEPLRRTCCPQQLEDYANVRLRGARATRSTTRTSSCCSSTTTTSSR